MFRYRSHSPYDGFTEVAFTKLVTGRHVYWTVLDSKGVDIDREAHELFKEIAAKDDVYPDNPATQMFT